MTTSVTYCVFTFLTDVISLWHYLQYKLFKYKIISSLLQTNSDFDAKPMVMLLGQYSTGKTTFIKHLLKTSYPGYVPSTCIFYNFRV